MPNESTSVSYRTLKKNSPHVYDDVDDVNDAFYLWHDDVFPVIFLHDVVDKCDKSC